MFGQFLALALIIPAAEVVSAPAQLKSAPDSFEEFQKLTTQLPTPAQTAILLNPSKLVTADNYPPDALEKEVEGSTQTWLLIANDGRVERCGIVKSSGSDSLDAQTCSLLSKDGQFKPARDAEGKPIRSVFLQTLTWQLEDETQIAEALLANAQEVKRIDKTLPKAARKPKLLNATSVASAMDYPKEALQKSQTGRTVMMLLLGADGRVELCGVEESSGSELLDGQACDLFLANAQFQPARDRRGRPVKSAFKQALTWRLQPSGVEIKDWISRLSFVIGPDGEARSCKSEVFVDRNWMEAAPTACDEFLRRSFYLLRLAKEKSKVEDSLAVAETWVLTTSERPIPDVGRRPGEVLLVRREGSASYDSKGKRTSCATGESYGLPAAPADVCTEGAPGAMPTEVSNPDGTPLTVVRMRSAFYLKDEPDSH